MSEPWSWPATKKAINASVRVFLRDVGNGIFEVSHNSLALVGLAVVGAIAFGASRPDLRHAVETQALSWLQERHMARLVPSLADSATPIAMPEPSAVERVTVANPSDLNRQQANVAMWLARRYRVAPEPVSRLVQEAWEIGEKAKLEPTLILAIMAIESGFNPFAQSQVGAQGLMQVMTNIHDDKYQPFGGTRAAFDPLTNVRVGVMVLKECIARAGSLEGGLKFYVGAANLPYDGGYAAKVLAEQDYLKQVAAGRQVPLYARLPTPVAPPPVSGAATPAEAATTAAAEPTPAGASAPPAASPADAPAAPAQPATPPAGSEKVALR